MLIHHCDNASSSCELFISTCTCRWSLVDHNSKNKKLVLCTDCQTFPLIFSFSGLLFPFWCGSVFLSLKVNSGINKRPFFLVTPESERVLAELLFITTGLRRLLLAFCQTLALELQPASLPNLRLERWDWPGAEYLNLLTLMMTSASIWF